MTPTSGVGTAAAKPAMTQDIASASSASPDIAAIVPHFQRRPGLLPQAVRSVFSQTIAERAMVVICDDESPVSAEDELRACPELPRDRIIVIRQKNGGAGAARNNALNHLPPGIRHVAFIDSDDVWRPHHLEHAMQALELGFDAYFADFVAVGYPGVGNMQRIGTLKPEGNPVLDAGRRQHALGVPALDHVVGDGGGLIQTSTVVYRFDMFPKLRFREEFYNGQDFFFWMDLSELGARFAFSFDIECDNGEGINIYQASGWGTDKSLQRLRNELFVWTSVERFYKLSPHLLRANRATIRNLQESFGRDLLHRLRHRKAIQGRLVKDILRMAPDTPLVATRGVAKALLSRFSH
jgi:succinoglycan biosynthesis protein ExoW